MLGASSCWQQFNQKKNIMPWFVKFETRQQGAIGEFSDRGISVTAESKDDAVYQALKSFQSMGIETRFPVDAYQFEENEL